ncbi:MAG: arsenite methyltransferase [Candidatus Nitrosopumilus sp. Bin_571-38]
MSQADDKIKNDVKRIYGKIASSDRAISDIQNSLCCSTDNSSLENSCCGTTGNSNDISKQLGYSQDELNAVPEGSNLGLGCGNPQVIASIHEGETVLDLGSGAGFDAFLALDKVGVIGKVIGVDMTPEMINKANENAKKRNFINVEFKLGEIENLPLENNTVDVIISNCVINLSPDKSKVYGEAFRVLKNGGRLAISDIISKQPMTEEMKQDSGTYCACISGASSVSEIETMLKKSGFVDIKIEPKSDSSEFIKNWSDKFASENYVVSASITALKL